MILDVGDKFTQAVAAFDEKKCFSHAAFKESAGLPRAYCLEFVNWVASPGSTINTNTVSQKLRNLKSQRMPVAIYSHSLFPDSTA